MIKAEGIVLRTTNYGESNKIVTLFTKEYGKIGLFAKGAKKLRSSLAAVSQVLFCGLCLFHEGRGLGVLYQGESIESFSGIRTDIEKMGYAAVIIELTDRLCSDRQPLPSVYDLLRRTLLLIEQGLDPAALTAIFSIKMMALAGIEPQLEHCVRCGGSTPPFAFSVSGGGLLCGRCSGSVPHALPLTPKVARLLLLFQKVPLKRIGKVELKQETIRSVERVIDSCYEQNAGIKLRSRRFIEQMAHFDSK